MDSVFSVEPRVRIYLLGGCAFKCDGHPVHLETAKTGALLAYLALQSDPQPRHTLMGLFWGDQPEANARRNLRHALWNIRQQLHGPDQPPVILSDARTIAFNPAGAWLDVRAFKNAVALPTAPASSDDRYARLRQASDLYRGALLAGVEVDDAPEFELWLLVEREHLRAQALETLQHLVAYYLEWGEYAPGLDYARRLLELEPWLEEAHRQMMRLLALGGQRSAALAQYETCRRVLAEELNTEPARETQALYESLRVGTEEHRAERATPRRKLPPQATPFVGREDELAHLAARLGDPAGRLITLVGPGGIGKTRLAVRAAAACERFRDGVCFVPLAGVATSDLLVLALADALGAELPAGGSPQAHLLDALREQELLLLLDNFEHLLAGADLIAEILRAAPGVKILVTSRERLNLREEWLFPVEGLRFPASAADPIDHYAAIQLFVQGAQRVRPGFALTEADQPFVVRLCQLVDGIPLEIELASNWARLLSCQEIAARVEQGLDFLTTSLRDLPPRHRSMRAVFEQSWQLLATDEREIFKRLTVFRGGFQTAAAEAVAGAHLEQLASLVDKSFLKRNPAGRYEVHELLRQYGAENLNSAEAAQACEAHGVYFAAFLHSREGDLSSQRVKAALEEVAEDLENVRASWAWAVQGRRVAEIGQASQALHRFFELRSWFQEDEARLEQATAALRLLPPQPEQQLVLARLYISQGLTCDRLSRYSKAVQAYEASIAIARQIGHRHTMYRGLGNLASAQLYHGAYAEAQRLNEEAMEGYRQIGDQATLVTVRINLGHVLSYAGDYPRARALIERGLEDSQTIGLPDNRAFARYFLGLVALGEKDPGQAFRSFQTGLMVAREQVYSTWGATRCLSGLASVALQAGEYEQAAQLAQECLDRARKAGSVFMAALCLNCLGQSAGALGQVVEARRYYQQAMRTAWEAEQWPPVLGGVIGMAEMDLKRGQLPAAGEGLAFAIQHPATIARERDRARQLFGQVETQLSPDALVAAQQRGAATELSAMVERFVD